MDRCALFVDAGYVLADGAMAVHGTRHRESVSWDYAGLLPFIGSIARERTGRPLLRCYWYEATVEGRRTRARHAGRSPRAEAAAGPVRPGRREGVEGEIRRDLTTLARNNAISDALLVSAEEDLAQVVADVQDLGIRVTIVHITVGGNWTISRSLRQECDDIIEVGEGHLRPYTELVAGATALSAGEPYQLAVSAGRALTNGHGPVVGPLAQQALAAGAHPAPPPSTPRRWWPSTSGPRSRLPSLPVRSFPVRSFRVPSSRAASRAVRRPRCRAASRPGLWSASPWRLPAGAHRRARGQGDPGVPPQSAQNLQAASGLQAQPGVSAPQRNPGPNPSSNPAQRQPGVPGQQSMGGPAAHAAPVLRRRLACRPSEPLSPCPPRACRAKGARARAFSSSAERERPAGHGGPEHPGAARGAVGARTVLTPGTAGPAGAWRPCAAPGQ